MANAREVTMTEITNRIFELIKERGLSQKEFAKKTGISEAAISDWKRKGTNPSASKIIEICNCLQVSPEELLGAEGIVCDYIVVDEEGEKELIERYRRLDGSQKARVQGYFEALLEK